MQVGGHAARLQAVFGGRAEATLINTVTAMKGVQETKVTVLTRISKEFPGLGYVWNMVRTDSVNKPELAAAYQTLTEAGIRAPVSSWRIPTRPPKSCTRACPI